jgi:hypothetical protein
MTISKFSLITVHERRGNLVSGNWVQNHVGTLETAKQKARHTEEANNNKIEIAVVDELPSSIPALTYWEDRKEL